MKSVPVKFFVKFFVEFFVEFFFELRVYRSVVFALPPCMEVLNNELQNELETASCKLTVAVTILS